MVLTIEDIKRFKEGKLKKNNWLKKIRIKNQLDKIVRTEEIKICKCGFSFNTEGDKCIWCKYKK